MNSNDIQNKINEMIKTNIDNLLDTKEVFNRITQILCLIQFLKLY